MMEMLVAISILVVLVAFSLVAIRAAKKSAAAVKDAGSLKQIFACMNLYAADNNDLLPGPLFTRQSPVYNSPIPGNPREWRRLSDCLAIYLGVEDPKKGDFIPGMAASWQKDGANADSPAWYMQQQLMVGDGPGYENPWGKPAPASNDERMPMKLGALHAQPRVTRTWAMTEMDQLHPAIKDPALKQGCPEGMAHGSYRLGVYFDGSVGKLDRNNKPM